MNRPVETAGAPKPFSNYSQAVLVDAGSRYIFVSGQVGADASGAIAYVRGWPNASMMARVITT
jgi:enamine deaminase RidA (YjgF/YER057c/UK114 family)